MQRPMRPWRMRETAVLLKLRGMRQTNLSNHQRNLSVMPRVTLSRSLGGQDLEGECPRAIERTDEHANRI